MKSLLSRSNRPMLARWLRDETLLAFDYDGTLVPVVSSPTRAYLSSDTHAALTQLSNLARVAVISGRARSDLLLRLPPELTYVVGNHGNEGLPIEEPDRGTELEHCCQDWLTQLKAMRDSTTSSRELDGMLIEDKGLTLSLHYRHCEDPSYARSTLSMWAAKLTPPAQVIDGVLVLNLLPPMAKNKRLALMALLADSGCPRAVYVGDDSTDEQVFMDAPRNWLTVRVGEVKGSHARYRLKDSFDVTRMIELAISEKRRAEIGFVQRGVQGGGS